VSFVVPLLPSRRARRSRADPTSGTRRGQESPTASCARGGVGVGRRAIRSREAWHLVLGHCPDTHGSSRLCVDFPLRGTDIPDRARRPRRTIRRPTEDDDDGPERPSRKAREESHKARKEQEKRKRKSQEQAEPARQCVPGRSPGTRTNAEPATRRFVPGLRKTCRVRRARLDYGAASRRGAVGSRGVSGRWKKAIARMT
jgi:hypothetical protein